jgi:hypothetical protein
MGVWGTEDLLLRHMQLAKSFWTDGDGFQLRGRVYRCLIMEKTEVNEDHNSMKLRSPMTSD